MLKAQSKALWWRMRAAEEGVGSEDRILRRFTRWKSQGKGEARETRGRRWERGELGGERSA